MEEERREEHEETEREAGRLGGAAAMAAGMPFVAERETVAFWTRDLIRWGPIWAGILLALAIQLVLGTIGLAIALSAYNPTAADFAQRVGSMLSIWSAISALVALFIGGYIAGRMAAALGLRNGLAQGSVVWALALLIGILFSAIGVAGLMGATMNIGPLFARGLDISGPEAMNLIRNTASGAWWFVIGSILAWAAAASGGVLGAAAHVEAIEES